ncbi:glycosyltransferase family 2 protein [Streptomyces justiciae]|uniref:glycosyltransferase family 2 protein n=1 Tax=Streptomyces justiciae TaxID=2780140 RepID=UPI001880E847|nr:glycosyltransferase family 2 protein [Streptomyces justiciae]MBE8474526.1 glycosyltransferase family 2 protein [Streptomyces justiciae]MCW8378919.1 glycosyltransferase family 2 protein [Streptomyces justiciae]
MIAAEGTPPTADVVIVNWNTGACLGECLRSIVASDRSQFRVARIVVVDNASTDGSADGLTTADIPHEVVRNGRNRGFATACNQGAARGGSDFVLFLNPDTRLHPDALRVVGRMLRAPVADGFGIFGALMVDQYDRPQVSCSRFPSLRTYVGKMTGLDQLVPALFPPHHLRPDDLTRSGPVDQVIGAFFLVRRSLFADLGGFDEGYFLYLEEVDFSLRARRAGWPSYHVNQARVCHIGQVSSAQLGPWRHYLLLCSRSRYAFRQWKPHQAWLLMVLSLSVEPFARLAVVALRRRWGDVAPTVAAYWRFLGWFREGHGMGPPPGPALRRR